MAVSVKSMSLIVALFGSLSFIFAVIAENKKPSSGIAIPRKDVVVCKYPSDLTVPLGYLSVGFLAVSTISSFYSLFYPYNGKSIPQSVLFRNKGFFVFFNIALAMSGLAASMLLWPTITEQLHHSNNIHRNVESSSCPTAKTGLLGGGAFLALDSCLFWLVSLMLACNARSDFFQEEESGDEVPSSYPAREDPIKGSA